MSRIVNKYFILEGIFTKFHYNAKNFSLKSNLLSKKQSKSLSSEEECVNVEQCRNDPCPPMLRSQKKEPDCKIESVLGSPVKQMYDAKVVIIGAGVAGLAAGQYLQNAGVHNYTILEALESIVLLNMASGKWSADLIMGFYKWKVLKIVEDAQVEPIPENIFMIFQELLSEEKSAKKKEELKAWLLKNRLPVVEDGVNVKVGDDLVIIPPYGIDQCLSTNEIVLDRIRKFITAMK